MKISTIVASTILRNSLFFGHFDKLSDRRIENYQNTGYGH